MKYSIQKSIKLALLVLVVKLVFINSLLAQVPVAYYDFELNSNRNSVITTPLETAASTIGVPSFSVSSLSAAHSSGNGASYGGSNAGMALGYFGFTTGGASATAPHIQMGPFDLSAFASLSVTMDIRGIGAKMPTAMSLYYSTDNITYTRVSISTPVTTSFTTRTFTLPSALNNSPALYFRIVGHNAGSAPNSSDGVMLIDNFTIRCVTISSTLTMLSSQAHGAGLSSGGTFVPVYGAFTVNGSGISVALADDITVNSRITLSNGTLSIGNNALIFNDLSVNPFSRSSGVLSIGSNGTLEFNNFSSTPLSLPSSLFNTSPVTLGTINLNAGSGNSLTLANNSINVSTVNITSGSLVFNNTIPTLTVSNSLNVSGNGTFENSAGKSISITGDINLTNGNLLTSNNAAVINLSGNLTGTGSQLNGGTNGRLQLTGINRTLSSGVTYNSVELNTASTYSLSSGNATINGRLILTQGTLAVGNNTLSFQNADVPVTRTSGVISVGSSGTIAFGTAGNTGGAAFTLPNNLFSTTTFGSFTINRTNAVTLGNQTFTLNNNLNLTAGVLNTNASTLTVNGNVTGTGTLNNTAGSLLVQGSGSSISGITTDNIQLNNAGGFSLTGSPTIRGILTLANGTLSVGSNSLTFHTGNTPIVRTSGTLSTTSSSNLVFGITGNTGGNAFSLPNNLFSGSVVEIGSFSINRTNSLTLNNQNLFLNRVLSVTAGSLILPSNYVFTLRSTSVANTALVGPVTGNIVYGTGATFVVERFIPQTKRVFRDIASSVNTGGRSIFQQWQENGTNGLDNGVNYGTHITGAAGSSGIHSTGFDITATGAATINTYDVLTGAPVWRSWTRNAGFFTNRTSVDTLSAFRGYRVLIRGNRLVNLAQVPTPTTMNAAATLRSRGMLVTGNVAFTTSSVTTSTGTNTSVRLNGTEADGFTMIGNPYACAVDWHALFDDASTVNIAPTYQILDPNLGTSGAYATYNRATQIKTPSNSNINRYIQPGQAFFIENTSTSPAITFRESHKSADPSNLTDVFKQKNQFSTLHIDLHNAEGNVLDGVAIAIDKSFSNTHHGFEDVRKIFNHTENIAIVNNNKAMSIDGRKDISLIDTFKIELKNFSENNSYKFVLQTEFFEKQGLKPILLDKLSGKYVDVSDNSTIEYTFIATNLAERFVIVFSKSIPLVALGQFKNEVALYPNPFTGNALTVSLPANIKTSNINCRFTIQNIEGKSVYGTTLLGNEANWFLLNLPLKMSAGMYTVSVLVNGERYNGKLVVQ